jgi:hypothetical protein
VDADLHSKCSTRRDGPVAHEGVTYILYSLDAAGCRQASPNNPLVISAIVEKGIDKVTS